VLQGRDDVVESGYIDLGDALTMVVPYREKASSARA
jgi:hypothetical protein